MQDLFSNYMKSSTSCLDTELESLKDNAHLVRGANVMQATVCVTMLNRKLYYRSDIKSRNEAIYNYI